MAKRLFQGAEDSSITWLPGLAHQTKAVGQDPKQVLVKEIEARRRRASPLKIWLLDVTFTGSTTFGNVTAALANLGSKGAPVDVTLAVLLPVEDNVLRKIAAQPPKERFDTGLRSHDGRVVWLRRTKRPPTVRSLALRIYPVRRSLTEDKFDSLELGYGRPYRKRPTYVRFLSENLTIALTHGSRSTMHYPNRKHGGDTAHDWIFSEVQHNRLPGILNELGLPADRAAAARDLARRNEYAQYGHGPICIRIP